MNQDSGAQVQLTVRRQRKLESQPGLTEADEALVGVLDLYLERRSVGRVIQSSFIAEQCARYPELELDQKLPGLIGSIDALNGFADEQTDEQTAGFQSDSWENLVSKTLGDYQILSEVGRGGMGIVYKARQQSLDRIVALKVLPVSVVLDQQQIARFMLEAQAAGQLHHPHIVPIYSVGPEDGVHCYSMPLIDGRSLDQMNEAWQANKPDAMQSIRWMIQAADAIEHAHQHGVIHRDIKPSNLIIDSNNKLWVSDFGLARCRHADRLTQPGVIVGTRRYMSPEQASGNPALVDHRSDIFALGMTLFELLTGQHGRQKSSAWATVPIDSEPTAFNSQTWLIRRHHPDISRDIETVVMKAIAPDAADRYQSAAELSADLRRALNGHPILARRPSTLERISKWTLRHRRAVAASTAVFCVLFVGLLGATLLFARQRSELQSALVAADRHLLVANQNRDRAEAHLRRTRDVLDRFGLMAAEQLRGVAGAEHVREALVRDVLRYYEDDVRQAESKSDSPLQLAETHYRAAKIIEELGANRRARNVYRRALGHFNSHLPSASVQYRAALCRNSIAVLSAELGEFAAAENEYRVVLEQLPPIAIDNADRTRTLATVHGNYGLLLTSLDRTEEAKRQFHLAGELLPEHDLINTADALTAAMIFNNLGHLVQDTDLPEALRYNQRAIHVLRSVVRIEHGGELNTNATHEAVGALALNLNNQASLLVRLDRDDEAITAYRDAIVLFRSLVDRLPMMVRYTEELAITYNNYGRCLHRCGHDRDARSALQRSHDLLENLVRRRPDAPQYQAALDGVRKNLARTGEPIALQNQPQDQRP
ncbi:Serine/threonine-protein kinase PrkC [Stieleria maiorica]|uniref:Serine/threonine-protein kinase PrkC n=1 Tax=Stieleria maiorica TaxID=2795974 RepID=A0A5B9MJ12_9BACT|nr:serine/threonine-protein kinase [Stieleria maiorica]QEG01189.1 Serine/threonine-protein kinase PrkC [Stieleria maiorica]